LFIYERKDLKDTALLNKLSSRLDELAQLPKLDDKKSVASLIEEKGFSRRDFMKWAGAMTAMLMLPASFTPVVARAAELSDRLPIIWLHMAECTGCSESLLRTDAPTIDSLIFDYISLEYHETLMAAAGWQAEENLEHAIEKYKNRYILMVEGGIPAGEESYYLTIGAHGQTGEASAKKASNNAAAIFAIGTCSSFGGVQAANPNPTNAQPLSNVTNKTVINVPGCPPSEKNIVGTLLHFILYGTLPALDAYNRPKWAYGMRIHDLCERRGHFDAGEFVEEFGDEGAKKGYCLYKVGCKGPYTFNNCSKNKFNSHMSWPIQAGHGCIGCSEPDFWDTMGPFEEPVADRLYDTVFGGMGADATADKIGVGLLTATAVGIAAHAVLSKVKNPKDEQE
jgi:quinone-reactive Ni/Fe-hydrogenase small subunit